MSSSYNRKQLVKRNCLTDITISETDNSSGTSFSNSTSTSSSQSTSSESINSSEINFKNLSNEDTFLSIDQNEDEVDKHELNSQDYDNIKKTFMDQSQQIEYKILNLIPDDQAINNLGFWNSLNQIKNNKILMTKQNVSKQTFTHSFSSNNIQTIPYTFRSFNDWRSHLLYYKQFKGYNKNLPDFLKEIHNKLPLFNQKEEKQNKLSKIKHINQLVINTKENESKPILKNQLYENSQLDDNNFELYRQKTNPSQLIKLLKNNERSIFSSKNSNLELNLNIKPLKKTLNRTNIDFKIDTSNKNNIKENKQNQNNKYIPNNLKINKINNTVAGGGFLRVSIRNDKPKNFLQQYTPNSITSLNRTNTNISFSDNDSTYYSITSLDTTANDIYNKTNSKINNNKNNNKKIIALCRRVNENEYTNEQKSTPVQILNITPRQRTSKNVKPILKINENFQVTQPSLTHFIANADFLQANLKNRKLKNIKTNHTGNDTKSDEKILIQQQTRIEASEKV